MSLSPSFVAATALAFSLLLAAAYVYVWTLPAVERSSEALELEMDYMRKSMPIICTLLATGGGCNFSSRNRLHVEAATVGAST